MLLFHLKIFSDAILPTWTPWSGVQGPLHSFMALSPFLPNYHYRFSHNHLLQLSKHSDPYCLCRGWSKKDLPSLVNTTKLNYYTLFETLLNYHLCKILALSSQEKKSIKYWGVPSDNLSSLLKFCVDFL